ncbi:hypothetical protein KIPB_009999, partial [Kipferlia bialata]
YEESGLDASFWSEGYPTAGALLLAMDEQSGRHWVMSGPKDMVSCKSVKGSRCNCAISVSAKGKGWHLLRFKKSIAGGTVTARNTHCAECVPESFCDLRAYPVRLFFPENGCDDTLAGLYPLAALSSTEVLLASDRSSAACRVLVVPSDSTLSTLPSSESPLHSLPIDLLHQGKNPEACVVGTTLYMVCCAKHGERGMDGESESEIGTGMESGVESESESERSMESESESESERDGYSFLRLEKDTYSWSIERWMDLPGIPKIEGPVSSVSLDERVICMWRGDGEWGAPGFDSLVCMVHTPETGSYQRLAVPNGLKSRCVETSPMTAVVRGEVYVVVGRRVKDPTLTVRYKERYSYQLWTLTPDRGGDGWVWRYIGVIPKDASWFAVKAVSTVGGRLLISAVDMWDHGCVEHVYTPETGEWRVWDGNVMTQHAGVSLTPTTSVQASSRDMRLSLIDPESLYPHPSLQWAEMSWDPVI